MFFTSDLNNMNRATKDNVLKPNCKTESIMNKQEDKKVLQQELKSICQELQEKINKINHTAEGHPNAR